MPRSHIDATRAGASCPLGTRSAVEAMRGLDGDPPASVGSSSTPPSRRRSGRLLYAASKAGVAGMTITAVRDPAQYDIRVMTIASRHPRARLSTWMKGT